MTRTCYVLPIVAIILNRSTNLLAVLIPLGVKSFPRTSHPALWLHGELWGRRQLMVQFSLVNYSLSLCTDLPEDDYHPPTYLLYILLGFWLTRFSPPDWNIETIFSLCCDLVCHAFTLYPILSAPSTLTGHLHIPTHICPGTGSQPPPLNTSLILPLVILSHANEW